MSVCPEGQASVGISYRGTKRSRRTTYTMEPRGQWRSVRALLGAKEICTSSWTGPLGTEAHIQMPVTRETGKGDPVVARQCLSPVTGEIHTESQNQTLEKTSKTM